MTIVFFQMNDEVNAFPKALENGVTLEGSLRGECDVLNPSIEVEDFPPNTTYNYCYIYDFSRYYFVTGQTSVNNKVTRFNLKVDVLQTYAYYIWQLEGVVGRTEDYTKCNPLFNDEKIIKLPTYDYSRVLPDVVQAFDDIGREDYFEYNYVMIIQNNMNPFA